MIVGVVYSAIGVLVPTVSGRLISAVVSGSANRTVMLGAFLLVSFLQICFAEADSYAGNLLKIKQKALMRSQVFRGFLRNDGAKREEISGLVSFVNNDIPSVAEQYFLGTIDILKCVSLIVLSALSLLAIHWLLALVIVGVSVAIIALPNTMRKKGGAARKRYSGILGQYNTTLQSMLEGVRLIKAYRCRKYSTEAVDGASGQVSKSEFTLLRHQLIVQGITIILQVAKTVLILLIGIALIARGEIDVGSLVAVIQLAEVISAPIEVLAYLRHGRNEVRPIVDRYAQMLENPRQEQRHEQAGDLDRLTVKHLSYRVGEVEILRDVSVSFAAGKKYRITGESGSGKSTLVNLLLRFYDPDQGAIYLAGQDLRTIAPETLRKKFGVVFQNDFVMEGTIAGNIAYFRDLPPEALEKAARDAQAGFIWEKEGGMAHPVAVRGNNLSGGQKQRLCIARALLKKPRILILDDSTSAVDTATEAKIRESFSTTLKGTTKLIIAQRITSVMEADLIVVMDEGKIVGQGSHEELLKSCEAYREICYSQMDREVSAS